MADELRVATDGVVRSLIINRPARRNALTPEVTAALAAELKVAGEDDAVRMVVIRGTGGHFSVGLDLHWIAQFGETPAPMLIEEGLRDFQSVIKAVIQAPVPVVAALEGNVAGFGFDLALACDLRYADPGAVLTSAFARIGLVPDGGSTMTLAELVGPSRAFRLLVDGSAVSATEALGIGLVDAVAQPGELDTALAELAQAIAGSARGSVRTVKRLMHRRMAADLVQTLAAEGKAQSQAFGTEDFRQRLSAFMRRAGEGQ